ncbi:MAG: sugar phosphate nucleotidyltransferase [Actinomycetota bacterium]|nr:sugar phosphate nucleotidyltransferase [Actinomycetota bacterium]
MARLRPLVLVLAGGAGSRMELLTQERAKPAVPFAGTHRLIDFPMSNCRNAGLNDVWVYQQFNPISLSHHISNGRPWDLDRTTGGLLILQPRLGNDDRTGFQQGTADALWRYAPLIREFDPDALMVVSADAVYALDYAALIDEHVEAGADATMVTTEVEPDDAGRYGVVQAGHGQIREYVYKPDEPNGNVVANEVFVFRPERLLDILDDLARTDGEDSLEDLGHEALPLLVDGGKVREHRFSGYWRDVGTVDAYWRSQQELLQDEPPIALDDPSWPILTHAGQQHGAARIAASASIDDSLVAPGSRVAGEVRSSVVGRGVVIEEGAVVRESVLLPGAVVRAGAHVERAVLDDGVEIGRDAGVGESRGEVALVGMRARVDEGARIEGGGRWPVLDD